MLIEKINILNQKSISFKGKQKATYLSGASNYGKTDLNQIPHYKLLSRKNPLNVGLRTLIAFQKEYGEVKSPSYTDELIRQKQEQNRPPEVIRSLKVLKLRNSKNYYKICKEMLSYDLQNRRLYCAVLSKIVKKEGAYLESSECAALIQNMLKNRMVASKNMCLYTKDSEGNKDYRKEHVFTIYNLPKDFEATDCSELPEDAIVCDVWAGICMKAPEAVEYYKRFFGLEDNSFGFEPAD